MNWKHILAAVLMTYLDTFLALPYISTIGAVTGHVSIPQVLDWLVLLRDGLIVCAFPAFITLARMLRSELGRLDPGEPT